MRYSTSNSASGGPILLMGDVTMTQDAVATLKAVTARMNRAFAQASALGLVSRPELARYRKLLKRGAPSRRPSTAQGLHALTKRFSREADRYELLLDGVDDTGAEVQEQEDEPRPAEIRSDEIGTSELATLGLRHRVALLMEGGATAQQAVDATGAQVSARTARRWYKRYGEKGLDGLVDRRVENEGHVTVMTPQVRTLILGLTRQYPAASHAAITQSLRAVCRDLGIECPSYESVKRFRTNLRPEVMALARRQTELWTGQYMQVQRVERAEYPNHRWQLDDTDLDLWVRVDGPDGEPVPVRAQASAVEDVYSRALMGIFVSAKAPDSWSVSLALRDAIIPRGGDIDQPHGLPRHIHTDRGGNYISADTAALCARLGIGMVEGPAYYPNDKGKIERVLKTLKEGRLTTVPGHVANIGSSETAAMKRIDTLLTISQLRQLIRDWVDGVYHQTEHRTTGATPIDRWRELHIPQMPASEAELNMLMLQSEERMVQKDGILFGSRLYSMVSEHAYVGQTVQLRYVPDDLSQVAVYAAENGRKPVFIGVAYEPGHPDAPTIGDVKASRNSRRKYINKAVKRYHEQVEALDRPTQMGLANSSGPAEGLTEPRPRRKAVEPASEASSSPAKDEEVRSIEELLKQKRRNEMDAHD